MKMWNWKWLNTTSGAKVSSKLARFVAQRRFRAPLRFTAVTE